MIEEEKAKYVIIYLNGKEKNKILLEDAINKMMNINHIVLKELAKSSSNNISVKINGKQVVPKDVKNMSIENVQTIEIFDNLK
jgi:hypothetical protein